MSDLDDARHRGKKPKARARKDGECQASVTDSQQGLSPALQDQIGRQLRAMFDGVAHEPVPDRFLQLLKDLEQSGDK